MGDSAGLLDDEVDGSAATVAHPGSVEVGHELLSPGSEGPAEAGDFGDGAAVEGVEGLLGDEATVCCPILVIHPAHLLVGVPIDLDLAVRVAGDESGKDWLLLTGSDTALIVRL